MAERKKKRLIIILNQNILNYDSYEYKEKINSAFKKVKINVQFYQTQNCTTMTIEKIDNKMHSSIVVTVFSQNDAEIIKSRLNVENIRCKTNKFNSTQSITECIKCQKFGHLQTTCKNNAKCEICVHKHETNEHMCTICKSKNSCSHINFKCANCNEAHVIKSQSCGIFLT